jgi:beta-lactamase class D
MKSRVIGQILYGIVAFSFASWPSFAQSKETSGQKYSIDQNISSKVVERPEMEKLFKKYNVDGSFLMFDSMKQTFTAVNYERTGKRFLPASTFKIPNALIFLETGIVTDPDTQIMKWDGTKYEYPGWSQDQTLRSAVKSSVVWYFQANARKVGTKTMQRYVDLFEYGNRDISAGVDKFWLEGKMAISQREQIDFLRKFYSYSLPVKKKNVDIVKSIIEIEKTDKYRLCGKTGLATRITPKIGWLIGYVETNGNVYFFATNIEQTEMTDLFGVARKAITVSILKELQII